MAPRAHRAVSVGGIAIKRMLLYRAPRGPRGLSSPTSQLWLTYMLQAIFNVELYCVVVLINSVEAFCVEQSGCAGMASLRQHVVPLVALCVLVVQWRRWVALVSFLDMGTVSPYLPLHICDLTNTLLTGMFLRANVNHPVHWLRLFICSMVLTMGASDCGSASLNQTRAQRHVIQYVHMLAA